MGSSQECIGRGRAYSAHKFCTGERGCAATRTRSVGVGHESLIRCMQVFQGRGPTVAVAATDALQNVWVGRCDFGRICADFLGEGPKAPILGQTGPQRVDPQMSLGQGLV